MNRTFQLRSFGLGLFWLILCASTAAAQSGSAEGKFMQAYCVSRYDAAPIYFSDTFETNAPVRWGAKAVGIPELYEAHLKEAHDYVSSPAYPVVCVYFDTVTAAEEGKRQLKITYQNMGKQIADSGWKLSVQQRAALPEPYCEPAGGDANPPPCALAAQEAAAAHAAATAPASSPTTSEAAAAGFALCMMSAGGPAYFSAPFPATGDYRMAFLAYLQKTYGKGGFVQCPRFSTLAEAQAYLQTPGVSAGIATGWVYTGSPN
jgi:hypothetical protein